VDDVSLRNSLTLFVKPSGRKYDVNTLRISEPIKIKFNMTD